uniref:Uncharacterized protein n=1 Tax=Arundo donax TaxID=35708 RepID=A0A0A8YYJ6_ARUDO
MGDVCASHSHASGNDSLYNDGMRAFPCLVPRAHAH